MKTSTANSKRSALMALLLLLPVPTIGVLAGLLVPATRDAMIAGSDISIGQAIYTASKYWILLLPLIWTLAVDRSRLSLSNPRRGGFGVGIISGLAIAGVIELTYQLLGPGLIDKAVVQDVAEQAGLTSPGRYLGLAAFVILFNALMEEYVWRWFVFRKCEMLMNSVAAVGVAALMFTLHHVFALAAYFDWVIVVLGSFGVMLGGVVWSTMYLRFRSIWPGYLSHAIVDIAIFWIGWRLIF